MTISVIIPAYNAQDHIGRAIDSVLGQTEKADEIVIVDDGSTDSTAEVIREYGDKVVYIYQQNSGSGATRNAAINAANCEWIAFLDSDDEWMPDKIKLQKQLLSNNPELVWAYSNFVRSQNNKVEQNPTRNQYTATDLLGDKEYFNSYLNAQANGLSAWTGTIIARRDAIIEVGMFNPELHLAQDIDLWFRLAYRYQKVGFVNAPLAIYHMETPNSNVKKFTDISHICKLIDLHINLSNQNDCFDEFRKSIYPITHDWVLRLSRERRYRDLRKLIKKYREFLPAGYYIRKNIRALFPGPVGCYNKLAAKLKNK